MTDEREHPDAEHMPRLIVLLGPTAVGKTKYSLYIAEQFGCEIISGDSMQVYRGMDVGTAKATEAERDRVKHHLIDTHNPDEPFSTASFQQKAEQLITQINARGHIPFIVGGTGLYIESVCYGYEFSPSSADELFRERQRQFAAQFGNKALHDQLRKSDAESAERIHPNDLRRIIRALEVIEQTGKPISRNTKERPAGSPYRLCLIGLAMERQKLYRRIEQRVDQMMEQGLVEEVKQLLEQGYSPDLVSMQALGYKEIVSYLRGEYNFDRALELLKRDTRRFAKRQLSWFRHMPGIEWIDVTQEENFCEHLDKINGIIAGKFQLKMKSEGGIK